MQGSEKTFNVDGISNGFVVMVGIAGGNWFFPTRKHCATLEEVFDYMKKMNEVPLEAFIPRTAVEEYSETAKKALKLVEEEFKYLRGGEKWKEDQDEPE